jgi:hypothetical protein
MPISRRRIDQALHEITGAAIGRDRRRVGEGDPGIHLHRRRPVDVDEVLHRVRRGRHRRIDIGAGIAVAGEAHGEKPAVLVERQFGNALVVATVMVAEETLRALIGPFHRTAELPGGEQERRVLGIGRRLHAERAADPAEHGACRA